MPKRQGRLVQKLLDGRTDKQADCSTRTTKVVGHKTLFQNLQNLTSISSAPFNGVLLCFY